MTNFFFILLGAAAGMLGGFFGIGGGIIIIPALIYGFGFNAQLATGTSLAVLVLPIGILGALEKYRAGNVDLRAVWLIAAGFFVASLIGAKLSNNITPQLLKRLFGIFLILVGIKTVWGK